MALVTSAVWEGMGHFLGNKSARQSSSISLKCSDVICLKAQHTLWIWAVSGRISNAATGSDLGGNRKYSHTKGSMWTACKHERKVVKLSIQNGCHRHHCWTQPPTAFWRAKIARIKILSETTSILRYLNFKTPFSCNMIFFVHFGKGVHRVLKSWSIHLGTIKALKSLKRHLLQH